MAENNKGFNKIEMTETERLAHLTQHLSHVLRFAGAPASKRPNPGVKRTLEIAGNNPGIATAELQGILKVDDEQFAELTGRMSEHGLATFDDGAKLTAKGEEVRAKVAAEDKETADKLFGALSADEQEQLKALYEKMIGAWHKGE